VSPSLCVCVRGSIEYGSDDSNCRNHLAFSVDENRVQRRLQKLPASFNRIYMNNIPDTTGQSPRLFAFIASNTVAFASQGSKIATTC
jgi:hypothetical protein